MSHEFILKFSSSLGFSNEPKKTTRKHHIMDITISSAVLVVVTCSTLGVLSPEATEMTTLTLLPMIGATFVMAAIWVMNPQEEKRNITMGRGIFGFLVGVPGPWAMTSLFKYWGLTGLEGFFKLPPLLILSGAAICFVAFILSYPFCRRAYERSDAISKHEIRRLERMSGMHDKPEDEP